MADSYWISPQVQRDLVELAKYLARHSVESADRLFDEFYGLVDRLAEFPGLGQQFPTLNERLEGLRVVRVPHFPQHLVFYLSRGGRGAYPPSDSRRQGFGCDFRQGVALI
jgi:plasmid stabilization system protein ParE